MARHLIARSTYTVEMQQLQQINQALAGPAGAAATAVELGLAGRVIALDEVDGGALRACGRRHVPPGAVAGVPGQGRLRRVLATGAPAFPYLYGLFDGAGSELVPVLLHTEQLRRISALLGLRHRWGVGPDA